jgi:hypothetical protein
MGEVTRQTTAVLGEGQPFATTKFDALLGWARKYSLQYPA